MILIILLTSFIFGSAKARTLPSYVEVCHLSDPKINDCFERNIELLRPLILNGLPELQIPSLNPLRIPEAGLNNGGGFKASFKNIDIYHAENFIMKKFDVDLNKYHIDVKILFPKLRIKSIYQVDGRVLVLNVKGTGPADGNFTNVEGHLVLDGTRYMKKGKEYLRFEKKELDFNVGKPHFQFDNIFGDNEELNVQTNKILNENVEAIVEEVKPVVNEIISEIILSIINRVFTLYSFDELFPQ